MHRCDGEVLGECSAAERKEGREGGRRKCGCRLVLAKRKALIHSRAARRWQNPPTKIVVQNTAMTLSAGALSSPA